jgi:hypothetical protein
VEGDRLSYLHPSQFPGGGVDAPDDGHNWVRNRSVRNVSTDRLRRSLETYHSQVHTPEGMASFDGPRRNLYDMGVKVKLVADELTKRGVQPGECELCWRTTPR